MSVIAEYSLPAEDLSLGRAAGPTLTVELERIVDGDGVVIAHLWARNGDLGEFERSLADEAGVESVRRVDEAGGAALYRGEFDREGETMLSALASHDLDVLGATGDADGWTFHLGFGNATGVSDFQTHCVDTAGLAIELRRLFDSVEGSPTVHSDLTDCQRETLVAAYEAGYFDIPRKITLVDLADRLEVSDQAVSERMRRGEAKLIETYLLGEEE